MRRIEKDDITIACGEGIINVRVGALIVNNNKLLVAGNKDVEYLYSVGGRIKFGETAEEAIRREVFEELGVTIEIDHLGIVHENYFFNYIDGKRQLVYEIAFYFFVNVNSSDIQRITFLMSGKRHKPDEFYKWIGQESRVKIYPSFLVNESLKKNKQLVHICTDERIIQGRNNG